MIWGPLKFENQLTDQILNSYVNFGLGFGFWSEVHLSEMTCYKKFLKAKSNFMNVAKSLTVILMMYQ